MSREKRQPEADLHETGSQVDQDACPELGEDQPRISAAGVPVAIVISRYNATITDRLLAGAIEAYEQAGGSRATLAVIDAPGAYELPILASTAIATGRFRAVVALGCLIRGQTRHDRIIAQAVAAGLMDASLATGVPITFGVLTVETVKQGLARSGGSHGNKGADAMRAALHAAAVIDAIALASAVGDAPRMPPLAVHDKARVVMSQGHAVGSSAAGGREARGVHDG
jgi:6,7-dimethyl-8-ribityllumazine synthase